MKIFKIEKSVEKVQNENKKCTTLADLEVGKSATIISVGGDGTLRRHFLDMGLIPGTEITLI